MTGLWTGSSPDSPVGDGESRGVMRSWGWSHCEWISTLLRRDRRPALSLLSAMWGYHEKTAVCKPRRGPSPDIRSAGTLIFDSSVSRTIRRKWFLLKSPSLWHFVTTTWAKIDNRCLYIMPSVPGMVVSTSYIWTHCQAPQPYEVNYYLHFTDEEIRAQRD